MNIKRHWEWNYILIIVWIMFFFGSLVFTYMPFKLMTSWVKTTWTVTHVDVYSDSDEADTYSVSARYNCWWKTVVWDSFTSSSAYNYRAGQTITLYCDENDPSTFVPKSYLNYVLFLFPFMWLFVFAFWIKKIVDKAKRKKLKQELTQFGTKVEATVTKIIPCWSVNKQLWYRIQAMCTSDTFLSEEIFADIDKILNIWDKIDVYLDYGDHSRYWMDTDSIFERDYDNTMIIN